MFCGSDNLLWRKVLVSLELPPTNLRAEPRSTESLIRLVVRFIETKVFKDEEEIFDSACLH